MCDVVEWQQTQPGSDPAFFSIVYECVSIPSCVLAALFVLYAA